MHSRSASALVPDEVRLAVAYAGVCGTDLALYSGDYPVALPLVLGHEFSGVVEAVGSARDSAWVGRRVTAEINNSCIAHGRKELCEACRRSMPTHCRRRTVLGIVQHDGAFAQHVIVPAGNLHALPENVSLREAIFVEPLAAALQTFEMTPLRAGDKVAILGLGRLGLLIAIVAKTMGAKVMGLARSPDKLERARLFGIVTCDAAQSEAANTHVADWTEGLGADIVVEATGTPNGLHDAIELVRPRGVVALKSTPGLPVEKLDLTRIVVDEICLQGSRCGPFEKALEFLNKEKPNLSRLISAEFPLQQVREALEAAATTGKVLLRCNDNLE